MNKLKNYLFVVLALLMITTITVNAAIDGKAAETPFTSSDDIRLILDDYDNKFDFGKVMFSVKGQSASSGNVISGMSELQKFIVSKSNDTYNMSTPLNTGALGLTKPGWYTAYCLDASKKIPETGLYNTNRYATVFNNSLDVEKIAIMTQIAMLNKKEYVSDLSNYSGAYFDLALMHFKLNQTGADLAYNPSGSNTYSGNESAAATALLAKLETGNSITVYVKDMLYGLIANNTGNNITLNYTTTTEGYKAVTFKYSDVVLDRYLATPVMASNNDYNHAVWIIEHSYPSMSLNASLKAAGADLAKVREQIQAVEVASGNTIANDSGISLDDIVESYVYYTVQHAIWYVTGGYYDVINGTIVELGNTMIGISSNPQNPSNGTSYLGNDCELAKLYNYLVKDRNEYTNYISKTFSNNISIDTSHQDNSTERGNYYVYGPFYALHDVMNPSEFTISFKTAIDGASIVNGNDQVISSVKVGEPFYIKCLKSKKIGNVKLSISGRGTNYANNEKAVIYYSVNPRQQNVLSGRNLVDISSSADVDLVFNPKTGVTNVAAIFIITLVAFSLGYLALNTKSKPIELD